MSSATLVSEIHFHRASLADRERGLLGWVTLVLHGLRVDGIQVRRTSAGHVAVYWPERIDKAGDKHPVVWPLDDDARLAIEREVIAELRRRGCIQ